ncbi:hypothetical protein Egran_06916, partial [Elaphomyces granulatus]
MAETVNESLTSVFDDPERQSLMAKLKYRFKGSLRTISPTIWACLWISSIEKLRSIVTTASQEDGIEDLLLRFGGVVASRLVQNWTQRTRRTSNSGNHSGSASGLHTPTSVRSTDGRSADERSKAVRRDEGRCLVTKAGAYNQVAHIYPYCLGARFTGVSRDMFWSSLSLFWTKDQIKSWKDVILGEKGTGNCVNLVTLSATAHVYWGKALFALKPISLSEDKRTLEVGFYWLRQFSHASWVDPLFRAEHFFPRSCVGNDLRLFDCKTGREICSGDTIVLK